MELKVEDPQTKFIAISCMEDMCQCIARMYVLCIRLGVTEVNFKKAIIEFIESIVEMEKDELP